MIGSGLLGSRWTALNQSSGDRPGCLRRDFLYFQAFHSENNFDNTFYVCLPECPKRSQSSLMNSLQTLKIAMSCDEGMALKI